MERKINRRTPEKRVDAWSAELQRLVAKPLHSHGAPTVIDGFKVPEWWECTWRRVPCRAPTCRFCGRFEKVKRLLESDGTRGGNGSDSDADVESEESEQQEADLADLKEVTAFQAKDLGIREEDVFGEEVDEDDFDENGEFIGEIEEPERLIPEPESFLLYRRVKRWSRPLTRYVGEAAELGEPWAKTDAAEDLLWYGTLIIGKVYRELSTRWEVTHGLQSMELMKPEYVYTGYVLREISEIITRSLLELAKSHTDLETPLKQFRRLKPSIVDITKG